MPSILNSGQKLIREVPMSTAPMIIAAIPSVEPLAPNMPKATRPIPTINRMILSTLPTFLFIGLVSLLA